MIRRLRSEVGQTSIELLGILPWLLLAGLAAWQILLTVSTASTTENAARSGSRAMGRGDDARAAVLRSLPDETRRDARVSIDGEKVTVTVKIPTLVPGLHLGDVPMTRSATLPRT